MLQTLQPHHVWTLTFVKGMVGARRVGCKRAGTMVEGQGDPERRGMESTYVEVHNARYILIPRL